MHLTHREIFLLTTAFIVLTVNGTFFFHEHPHSDIEPHVIQWPIRDRPASAVVNSLQQMPNSYALLG